MGYPWLQFLGMSRLRHFLKLLPLFSKQFQSSLVPYIQFFRYKLLNSNLDPKGTFGVFFIESGYWLQLFGPKITYITKNMTLGLDVFVKNFVHFVPTDFSVWNIITLISLSTIYLFIIEKVHIVWLCIIWTTNHTNIRALYCRMYVDAARGSKCVKISFQQSDHELNLKFAEPLQPSPLHSPLV